MGVQYSGSRRLRAGATSHARDLEGAPRQRFPDASAAPCRAPPSHRGLRAANSGRFTSPRQSPDHPTMMEHGKEENRTILAM
eukprot:6876733-Pyramimonas_sp.AAC.1